MRPQPKVSICMITYGHEKFIEQAINGVLMQECDFEIELILANDCSPDKTDEIINTIIANHPKASWVKYTRHDKNLGMMPNFIFALQQCRGTFIAVCEGDDYWTDPLKLQKQVDFLQNNEQASGCFHNSSLVDANGDILSEIYSPSVSKFEFYDQKQCLIILQSSYATCSLVFRRAVLDCISKTIKLNLCDELLDLVITEKGLLYFLNFNGSNYRFHYGGIWNGSREINNKIILYKRTIVLFAMFSFKQKYKIHLENRIFTIANHILFSKEIKRRFKVDCFFNTLQYLDFKKKRTYLFILKFALYITGIRNLS